MSEEKTQDAQIPQASNPESDDASSAFFDEEDCDTTHAVNPKSTAPPKLNPLQPQ